MLSSKVTAQVDLRRPRRPSRCQKSPFFTTHYSLVFTNDRSQNALATPH